MDHADYIGLPIPFYSFSVLSLPLGLPFRAENHHKATMKNFFSPLCPSLPSRHASASKASVSRNFRRRISFVLSSSVLTLSTNCYQAKAQTTPPATFSRTVTLGSSTVTLNFKLHSVRSSNFEVYTQNGTGSLVSSGVDVPRTYLGTVTGMPGAIVAGLLKADNTLYYKVILEDGTSWQSTGGTAGASGSANWIPAFPTRVVGAGGAGSSVYACEEGVDVTNRFFVDCGSSVAETLLNVEWAAIKVDAIFLRDAAIGTGDYSNLCRS